MKILSFFLTIILIFQFYSCNKSSSKIPYLAEDEIVNLFIELHLADNILDINEYRKNESNTYSFYNSVFQKYSITHTEFDSCLTYFANNPREYKRIYKVVTDSLTKLKKEVFSNKYKYKNVKVDKEILWNYTGKRLWTEFGKSYIPFKVRIKDKGIYSLIAKIKLNSDDLSINPRMKAFFTSSKDKKISEDQIIQIALKKDGKVHDYELKMILSDLRFSHIEGYLFVAENEREFYQDIEILDAKIFYLSKF